MASALAAGNREQSSGLIERIAELLEVTYRSGDLGNFEDPLEEAVYIMISRQTREGVYREVFAALRERYPRWEQAAAAPRNELRDLLRPAGFYEQRADQLKALLEAVAETNRQREVGPFGRPTTDLTLDFVREMGDEEAEAFLRALPGIGPKSARCILSYSLGRDTFAVDTHVRRIFIRLGLAESRGIKADHDPFQEAVPPRLRRQLHVNMVHHYRACWYAETGELTIERLDPAADLALEDFHRGIAGPVEVLARFSSRAELERVLGRWPSAAPDKPRTVQALRELTGQSAKATLPRRAS